MVFLLSIIYYGSESIQINVLPILLLFFLWKSQSGHCSQTMLKKVLIIQECTFRVLFLPKIDSIASNMDFQCKTLWNFLYSLSYWSIFNLVLISTIAEILHLLLSLQFSYSYLNNIWFLRQTFFKKAKNLHNSFFCSCIITLLCG